MPGIDREALVRAFEQGDVWFETSPLYQVLSRTVASDEDLLELAAEVRPGQQPTNMLFAAAHLLVLKDPELPFARFYASVRGDDAEPPEGAGTEFASFCADHRSAISRILRRRLVQTNVPRRAVAVRLAMREVARRVPGSVTLLEIGTSAGIQLLFDRWALLTGGRRFGPKDAPLTLGAEWRSDRSPPDLDSLPPVRDRLGIDLRPVDATDPEQRLWLQALVWPEHRERFAELATALDVVAADPPTILQGDAVELLPRLDEERLAADIPLVVFHAMVRVHVAPERRPAFDAAIVALSRRRRVLHVSMEPNGRAVPLTLRDSEDMDRDLALVEGHGRWIEPLEDGSPSGARRARPSGTPNVPAMTGLTNEAPTTGYAPVNGLQMYYEVHGSGGTPLLLLHGGLFDIDQQFGEVLPTLAATRQVIAADFQGHGRTNDIDRPLTSADLASDVVGLLEHLQVAQADVFGFSVGGGVALHLAIRHPELVRKLIVSSASFNRDGDRPENKEAVGSLTVDMIAGTPMEAAYKAKSPHPDRLQGLLDKLGAFDGDFPGWSDADVQGIAAPTLITVGDCDAVTLEHAVRFLQLRGGDVNGDFVGVPASQLAVFPGSTHFFGMARTALVLDVVQTFLDAPMPEA